MRVAIWVADLVHLYLIYYYYNLSGELPTIWNMLSIPTDSDKDTVYSKNTIRRLSNTLIYVYSIAPSRLNSS